MDRLLTPLTRRQFILLGLVGAATTLIEAACQASPSLIPTTMPSTATPESTVTATPTPSLTPQAIATPSPSPAAEAVNTLPPLSQARPEILKNRNDPHYNVRYVNPFPSVDHEACRLEVTGLVDNPGSFGLGFSTGHF